MAANVLHSVQGQTQGRQDTSLLCSLTLFDSQFTPATRHLVCSNSDAPKTALSTPEESSAASCNPAACAQHQRIETCQQHPTSNSPPAELPPAPQSLSPPPFCNDSTVADQQAPLADSVIAPAAVTSDRNGFAAAPKIPADVPLTSGPKQHSVLAEPALMLAPPRPAAQMASGGQHRSRCAMEVMIDSEDIPVQFSACNAIRSILAGAYGRPLHQPTTCLSG